MDNTNAVETIRRAIEMVKGEVKKVIIGKDDVIEKVLIALLANGHVLLEDVPGVGKTTMALAFSRAMDLSCNRVQFTSDTMAADIVGYNMYNQNTGRMDYREGAVFCNMLLADEINRTSPKTQAALLEAMEERRVTVDGVTRSLPEPFICIATENPLGSAGTQRLPDSQLDRFMMRLHMGYPSIEEQVEIIADRQEVQPLDTVEQILNSEQIMVIRQYVQACFIHRDVIRFASELCEATRHREEVLQGVSPRAVQALTQAAKGEAVCRGRGYVIPDDITNLLPHVCAHRLILTGKARVHNVTEEEILGQIIGEIKPPAVAVKE